MASDFFLLLIYPSNSSKNNFDLKYKNFERTIMIKLNKSLLLTAALLVSTFGLANCGSAETTKNTTANTNTATVNAKPASTTEVVKTDAPAGDTVGVPECDEYIAKYEACLTKIAEKAPQVQTAMKTAFEQQRSAFKQAAANPTSKATLPATCKQAIESVKQATGAYACTW